MKDMKDKIQDAIDSIDVQHIYVCLDEHYPERSIFARILKIKPDGSLLVRKYTHFGAYNLGIDTISIKNFREYYKMTQME